MEMQKLAAENDGVLPSWAWPGGYPLYYLDKDNCVLCPKCANKYLADEQENFRPVAYDVHWEGEALICEQCNAKVESAYGVPDEYKP